MAERSPGDGDKPGGPLSKLWRFLTSEPQETKTPREIQSEEGFGWGWDASGQRGAAPADQASAKGQLPVSFDKGDAQEPIDGEVGRGTGESADGAQGNLGALKPPQTAPRQPQPIHQEVPKPQPQPLPQGVPPDPPQPIYQEVPQPLPQGVPPDPPQPIHQEVPKPQPQPMPQGVPPDPPQPIHQDVPKPQPQPMPQGVPPDPPQPIYQEVPKPQPQPLPHGVPPDPPQPIHQDVPKPQPQPLPQGVPLDPPQPIHQEVPKPQPQTLPQGVPPDPPQPIHQEVPKPQPQPLPQGAPQDPPQPIHQEVPKPQPQPLPQGVPPDPPQPIYQEVPKPQPQPLPQGVPPDPPQPIYQEVPKPQPQPLPQGAPQDPPQPAEISGSDTGTVREDAALTTGGTLKITDPDPGEAMFAAVPHSPGTGGFGSFTLTPDGQWTYTLDNSQNAVQQLGPQSAPLTDTLTIHSVDGTQHLLTVTISGTNDIPVVSPGDLGSIQAGTLTTFTAAELLQAVQAYDPDLGDHVHIKDVQVDPGHGTFSTNLQGDWVFSPAPGLAQDDLSVQVTVVDNHGAVQTTQALLDIVAPPVTVSQVSLSSGSTSLSGNLAGGSGGWAIDNGHGVGVLSQQGLYGTLTINPDTGDFGYSYIHDSDVIKSGAALNGGVHADSFSILQHGKYVGDADVQVKIDIEYPHGQSGHHIDHTTLQGIVFNPTPSTQHDEPEMEGQEGDVFVGTSRGAASILNEDSRTYGGGASEENSEADIVNALSDSGPDFMKETGGQHFSSADDYDDGVTPGDGGAEPVLSYYLSAVGGNEPSDSRDSAPPSGGDTPSSQYLNAVGNPPVPPDTVSMLEPALMEAAIDIDHEDVHQQPKLLKQNLEEDLTVDVSEIDLASDEPSNF
jgi:VCBS repeat-containing protein